METRTTKMLAAIGATVILLLSTGVVAADTGSSSPSWGIWFLAAGIFLILLSPLMGIVSIRNGNVFGTITWWMVGMPLGVGLLLTGMA